MTGEPLGEKRGDNFAKYRVGFQGAVPQQFADLLPETVVGLDVGGPAGKVELLHILLFQREVILRVLL